MSVALLMVVEATGECHVRPVNDAGRTFLDPRFPRQPHRRSETSVTTDQKSTTKAISRRTIVRGAVWSVPVIAVAATAPLATASGCVIKVIDWNTFSSGTTVTPSTVLSAAGSDVTARLTSSGTTSAPFNLVVTSGPDGGISGNYVNIALPGPGSRSQTVTVTFSRPVTDVSFTVGDIDAQGTLFQESVYLAPESFTVLSQGSTLTGSGTAADPWVAAAGVSVPPSSSSGNAAVMYAGPIQSFSITLLDHVPATSTSSHSIDLFNISFCDLPQ